MKNLKANIMTSPITMGIGMIAVIVFLITKLPWSYYLIGLVTGLLSHGLLIKMNRRVARNLEKDPECKIYNPTIAIRLGSLLRISLIVLIVLAVIFKVDLPNNKDRFIDVIFTILGYLTYRVIFIICLLIYKDEELSIGE